MKVDLSQISWLPKSLGCWEGELLGKQCLKFTDLFVENGWCTNAHQGVIIDGQLTVAMTDKSYDYQVGDVIHIVNGSPHQVRQEAGVVGVILLF